MQNLNGKGGKSLEKQAQNEDKVRQDKKGIESDSWRTRGKGSDVSLNIRCVCVFGECIWLGAGAQTCEVIV